MPPSVWTMCACTLDSSASTLSQPHSVTSRQPPGSASSSPPKKTNAKAMLLPWDAPGTPSVARCSVPYASSYVTAVLLSPEAAPCLSPPSWRPTTAATASSPSERPTSPLSSALPRPPAAQPPVSTPPTSPPGPSEPAVLWHCLSATLTPTPSNYLADGTPTPCAGTYTRIPLGSCDVCPASCYSTVTTTSCPHPHQHIRQSGRSCLLPLPRPSSQLPPPAPPRQFPQDQTPHQHQPPSPPRPGSAAPGANGAYNLRQRMPRPCRDNSGHGATGRPRTLGKTHPALQGSAFDPLPP